MPMLRETVLFGVFVAIGWGGAPRVAGAATLTLADAVSRALARGPDAVIARLEAERAESMALETRSSYLPLLELTSQAGYSNRQDRKLRAIDAEGVERRYGLSSLGSDRGWLNVLIRQLILDLRTWREIGRSKLEAEAAQVAEMEQREGITFAVLEHYTGVLKLEDLIAVDEERLHSAQWLDEQAEVLFGAGRLLAAEREQAAIHLDEVQMERQLRSQALAQAHAGLGLVIGLGESEAETMQLAAGSVPDPEPAGLSSADEDDVLKATPELRTLDLRHRARELQVSAARAGRLPRLAAYMGYSHYGTQRFDNFDDELLVAMDFEMPLFDGFRSRHAIAGASKEAEIARTRYRTMLERKRVRVRDLRRRLQASAKRPELARRRATLARERLRLTDLNLQGRRGTFAEALAARAGHTQDAAAAVDAELDRILLWATLQRELGQLSAAILAGRESSAP
jgi:outer membrane protein TolC